jgi:hypothetical protein
MTSAVVYKENRIQYKLGIGLTDRKVPALRTVKIFGAWVIKKGIGLIFEVKYENGKASAVVLGAEAALTDKGTVALRLRSTGDNRDLGVTVELSQAILKGDGEAFLRMLASRREAAVYAGAAWRW